MGFYKMKRKIISSIIFGIMSATTAFSASASGVAGSEIGSASQTISYPVSSSTCEVSFPTNFTGDSIAASDIASANLWTNFSTQEIGNVVFSNCRGESVSLKVTTTNTVSSQGYISPTLNGAAQGVVGYWLSANNEGLKPNSIVDAFQNMQVTTDEYMIPVKLEVIKQGSGSIEAGTLNATITYTATYA